MIKRKNPFRFYCVILILNLSRLISPTTILVSKVCHVWFLKCIFDFQNLTLLISKVWCVWFPKFIAFDFSNTTFDFQNLSRLILQMTLLISKICCVWFLKWHFWFPKFIAFDFSNNTFDFHNLLHLISQMTLLISKLCHVWFPKFVAFDFSNDTFDFQNFVSLPAGGSPLVWWVDKWPLALLFSARVWLPCQAKEFVKMVCSVMEFSHYYVRLLLDVLKKNVALKVGFRRKNIGLYEGSPKMTCNNSSSLPECHLRHKRGPHKKILMKRGVHHVLQEL